MKTSDPNFPKWILGFNFLSLFCLLTLHFVSPEFEPHWRMVSEYALGRHQWILTLFFVSWGSASCLASLLLWNKSNSKAGKAGVLLLFLSGIGEVLAAVFDVRQPTGHGFAGLLGIPTLPIAVLLISHPLVRMEEWLAYKKTILISAHITWISLLLLVVTMMIMMAGFQKSGVPVGPDAAPPTSVPEGVIALAGYANRILILAYQYWLILLSKTCLKIQTSKKSPSNSNEYIAVRP